MNDILNYYENNAAALCARYETADLTGLHAQLLALLPTSARVLELGSGSGRDGAFLVAHGRDWTGIEGARAMAARSRALHPDLQGRILCADLRHPLPFPDATFSAAFSLATLMHLQAPAVPPVLKELARILNPNAPFLLSVPLTRPDVDPSGFDPKGRYFLPWNETQWRDACTTAGFTVTNATTNHDSLNRQITWLNLVSRKDIRTVES